MLRRTRVASTPDMSRISQAVSRPGIDPRTWCSLAIALDEEFLDTEFGSFIDVQLLPTGEALTCYVPQQYAGAGFGEHQQTIHKDDQLAIIVPNGDFAQGGIVVARFHTKADKPADLAAENPADFVRVQEKDTNWRIQLQGTAKFIVGSDDILLGEEEASEQLILGTTYRDKESTLHQDIIAELASLATQVTTAGTNLSIAGPIIDAIIPGGGTPIALAGVALTSAVTNITNIVSKLTSFEAQATSYLSNTSKTK